MKQKYLPLGSATTGTVGVSGVVNTLVVSNEVNATVAKSATLTSKREAEAPSTISGASGNNSSDDGDPDAKYAEADADSG